MVAHFKSLKTERKPTFSRRLKEPNPSAFVRRAGDDGVELLSNLSRQQQRSGRLAHLTLNFGGGIFLISAVLGEFRQFRNGVGNGAPANAAFRSRWVMRSGKRRFGAVECV